MDRPIPIEELLDHAGWLRRLAAALVGEGRADDLVQDTWIAALRFPPRGAARPWLARVATNLARNARRAAGRREAHERATEGGEPPAGPERAAAEADAQRWLADAVARLDEPLRTVIVLRYFRDQGLREIARELGLPPTTVGGRLQRGLAALRADLDRKNGGERAGWALALARLLPGPVAVSAGTVALWTGAAAGLLAGAVWLARGPARSEDEPPTLLAQAPVALVSAPSTPERAPSVDGERAVVPAEPALEEGLEPAPEDEGFGPADAEISGYVLVDGKAPAETIWLSFQRDETVDAAESVYTRPDGSFVFAVDEDWSGRIRPPYLCRLENGEEVFTLLGPETGLVIRLHELPTLRGRAVDADGDPVPEVHASLRSETPGLHRKDVSAFGEGQWGEGCFRFSLPEGQRGAPAGVATAIELVVIAPGIGKRKLTIERIDLAVGLDLGDVHLEPFARVPYRLLDARGVPIALGSACTENVGTLATCASTETDRSGAGAIFVPEEGARVTFGALGFADQSLEVHPGDDPQVTLEPAAMLTLCLAGRDRAGIAALRIHVVAHEPLCEHEPSCTIQETGYRSASNRVGTPEDPGLLELIYAPSREGRLVLQGLRPDVPFEVEVRDGDGRTLWSQQIALGAHEWRRLELELGP